MTLSAVVDGAQCATVSLTDLRDMDSDGNKVMVLGLDGQPEGCGRQGARITLLDGRGRTIAGTYIVELGTTRTLRGLAEHWCTFPGLRLT
jgi:hypothetical protein